MGKIVEEEYIEEEYIEELKDKSENENTKKSSEYWMNDFKKVGE